MSLPDLSEAFLSQNPACHWIVDRQGVFQQIHGGSHSLFEQPPSQLAGQPLTEVLDSEQAAAWMSRIERVFAGETLSLRERRGESTWYISFFPIRVDGEIRYAGSLAR